MVRYCLHFVSIIEYVYERKHDSNHSIKTAAISVTSTTTQMCIDIWNFIFIEHVCSSSNCQENDNKYEQCFI